MKLINILGIVSHITRGSKNQEKLFINIWSNILSEFRQIHLYHHLKIYELRKHFFPHLEH